MCCERIEASTIPLHVVLIKVIVQNATLLLTIFQRLAMVSTLTQFDMKFHFIPKLTNDFQTLGICDGGIYMNLPACQKDGRDCTKFLKEYPNCIDVPEPELVGDGICNGVLYNTPECDNDGGDCLNCDANITLIGNGICDGGEAATAACGFDGLDCKACIDITGIDPGNIGDGYCDKGTHFVVQQYASIWYYLRCRI